MKKKKTPCVDESNCLSLILVRNNLATCKICCHFLHYNDKFQISA